MVVVTKRSALPLSIQLDWRVTAMNKEGIAVICDSFIEMVCCLFLVTVTEQDKARF